MARTALPFTRTAWEGEPPLDFLVAGGDPVGDVDVGYGPARVLTSGEVRQLRDALAALTEEDLAARFDPVAMTKLDIYPSTWDRPRDVDDTLGYLMENYAVLRTFIEDVARGGQGIVISIM